MYYIVPMWREDFNPWRERSQPDSPRKPRQKNETIPRLIFGFTGSVAFFSSLGIAEGVQEKNTNMVDAGGAGLALAAAVLCGYFLLKKSRKSN